MGNGRRYLEYQGRFLGQRTASVPKQGGVESLSTTEKASGQRLLSTEKRIDAKQFHLARDSRTLHKRDHSSTGHIGEGSDFESVEDERQGGA